MKTIRNYLFLIVGICLLTACSETDELLNEDLSVNSLKNGIAKVMPSMATDVLVKAEEDWNNINDALQNANPGEVVQLAEGQFYLHKSIIRWDFNGTLKGSGMDKTTIQTVPGQLFDVSECPPLEFSFKTTDGFFMFCFAHHYNKEMRTVAVSDMTIIVDEPTTPYYQYVPGKDPEEGNSMQALHVQYKKLDNDLVNPVNLNVIYKNIAVIGEENGRYLNKGYSLYAGLAAFGASIGSFEAKNVKVENAHLAILPLFFIGNNSTVTVKNCKTDNNNNAVRSSLSHSWRIVNCDFKYSKRASLYLNNNPDAELPVGKSFIKNNKINVSGGVAMATYDMDNTELKNNVFYGSGYTGLYTERGNNWSIVNNDFCGIIDPILGGTLFLINPMNFEVKNNINQVVAGVGVDDPSNIIGEGRECD
ncbi:right-handed parallel beta-helix repeat-containing protein [Ancylomarina sp. YFZ004]